jgi:hypothetical protein
MISDKLDSRSLPIVGFQRFIALKDPSFVADDTGIVSMILMMVYRGGFRISS